MDQAAQSLFFEGVSLFLTGGLGFVGKALLAKLLLGNIGAPRRIYLLARPKGGTQAAERLNQLAASPAFDEHRKMLGVDGFAALLSDVVVLLAGDLSQGGLGLAEEDRCRVVADCEVFVNCAAAVGFDLPLSSARRTNTKGPLEVLKLARECQAARPLGVLAFVHVSSCYANVDRAGGTSAVSEQVYPAPTPVASFLAMSDEDLDKRSDKLCSERSRRPSQTLVPDGSSSDKLANAPPALDTIGFPNTYAYSKRMGESALEEAAATGSGIPIVIVRPSIIGCSAAEPRPGWIDTPLATGAYMLAGGLGVVAGIPCHSDMVHDLVPLDTVVDAVLAAAACADGIRPASGNAVPVVHVCSSQVNPVTLGEIVDATRAYFVEHPSRTKQVRKCTFHCATLAECERDMASMRWRAYVLSKVPCLRRSGRALQRAVRQAGRLDAAFRHFVTHEWHFDTQNLTSLPSLLAARGQPVEAYARLHIERLRWGPYLALFCCGLRRYLLKEEDAFVPVEPSMAPSRHPSDDAEVPHVVAV